MIDSGISIEVERRCLRLCQTSSVMNGMKGCSNRSEVSSTCTSTGMLAHLPTWLNRVREAGGSVVQ